MTDLPIEPLLAEISATLQRHGRLVLAAPPGAGKTTRVPLALAGLIPGHTAQPGKILVLEPRRIAARLAAERMASTLGQPLGRQIGLATRIDRKISRETVVEVITDGLFIRRILADPELQGVSAIIFDEIHERGLNADLGLALALEVQDALRDDLHILTMSATLDTATLAARLDAPILESEGRQYPVDTRYLGRTRERLEDQMVKALERAVAVTDGSILAFLPGAGEIRRVAERLNLPGDVLIAPLYGALSPQAQDAAIRPRADGGQKIVLATDIAESALTIEGVSVVVDSGYARVPVFDPAGGTTRLQTVRASRASADQRRGRAGRLGPGVCYRLWDEAETKGLVPAPAPEILGADLSSLALTLAEWGETDPARLTWLDPPPTGRLRQARNRLTQLGALSANGQLTDKGRSMAHLPLPPELSALIVSASSPGERALAAEIAALAGERGIGGNTPDLAERLARFRTDRSPRAAALRTQAARWADGAAPRGDPAMLLARAWPDRIARRRTAGQNIYLLASGRAGRVDETSSLAKSDWLVVADMVGGGATALITLAGALDEAGALAAAPPQTHDEAVFDPAKSSFRARRVKSIGAIILSEQPLPKPSGALARTGFLAHLKAEGFAPTGLDLPIRTFLARLDLLRKTLGADWPSLTIDDLQEEVEDWLGPALGSGGFNLPTNGLVTNALKARLDWPLSQEMDVLAPLDLSLPVGRRARIDWLDERAPLIECKVQELYGCSAPISIAKGQVPVTIQMLSPGGKPVATTRDLPGFWSGGYADMAKDMRGRYPKHDWPDDPAKAKPHAGLTKARLGRS